MRGKIILLLCCAAWSTAALAKSAPKWRWSLTSEMHADSYNGAKPADPQIKTIKDVWCETALDKALLDRFLMRGMEDECRFDALSYAAGKIAYRARCNNKADETAMTATGAGTYDERSFRVDSEMYATVGNNKLHGTGTMVGARQERCG